MSGDDPRSAILGRIRAATADVPEGEATAWEGPFRPVGPPAPAPDLQRLFAERVADYRATVTPCAAGDVASAVAAVLSRHAAATIVVPPGLVAEWLPAGVDALHDDPPLDVRALDRADGVLTGAALGIAETGTLVLDGGPACGRRVLTLVPDLHVCVVRTEDLVGTVPEAFTVLADAVRAGRPLTLVSGPSATSDIELDRVEGVHGPRRLEVLLVGGAPAS